MQQLLPPTSPGNRAFQQRLRDDLNHVPISAGDILQDGDVIAQIETDKVTIDVRYTEAKPGKLKEILVGADDTVTVGQAVCIVEQVPGSQHT